MTLDNYKAIKKITTFVFPKPLLQNSQNKKLLLSNCETKTTILFFNKDIIPHLPTGLVPAPFGTVRSVVPSIPPKKISQSIKLTCFHYSIISFCTSKLKLLQKRKSTDTVKNLLFGGFLFVGFFNLIKKKIKESTKGKHNSTEILPALPVLGGL